MGHRITKSQLAKDIILAQKGTTKKILMGTFQWDEVKELVRKNSHKKLTQLHRELFGR